MVNNLLLNWLNCILTINSYELVSNPSRSFLVFHGLDLSICARPPRLSEKGAVCCGFAQFVHFAGILLIFWTLVLVHSFLHRIHWHVGIPL